MMVRVPYLRIRKAPFPDRLVDGRLAERGKCRSLRNGKAELFHQGPAHRRFSFCHPHSSRFKGPSSSHADLVGSKRMLGYIRKAVVAISEAIARNLDDGICKPRVVRIIPPKFVPALRTRYRHGRRNGPLLRWPKVPHTLQEERDVSSKPLTAGRTLAGPAKSGQGR